MCNMSAIKQKEEAIKKLIKAREKIKKKNSWSKKEKIELNVLCKTIRREFKDLRETKRQKIIQETLEGTKNIKKMRKNLSLGKKWTVYLMNDKREKIRDREKVNEVATKFYANLYEDNSKVNWTRNVDKGETNLEEEPFIMRCEVETVVKKLKKEKAAGSDKITNEHLIYGGKGLIKIITYLFNMILKVRKVPKAWKDSDIILLYKKGDKHLVKNYRPISLSSTLLKVFAKVLEKRLNKKLGESQPCEQAGFRSGFSTIDHLFTLNQLIEKTVEHQMELHMAFIDCEKAFDSLKHEFLINTLRSQGAPARLTALIHDMYTNLKARIITERPGRYFPVNRGVKQGDPLSPMLFNAALQEIFKKLHWESKGISINGKFLNNLRFADDVALIAKKREELEIMILELDEVGKKAGLKINFEKTKILSNTRGGGENAGLIIGDQKIEEVEEIKYLGQIISFKKNINLELNARIASTWKKFWALKNILKGKFSRKHKGQILNGCVFPTLSYGCQTWALSKADEVKIQKLQNNMERAILGIKLKDKVKISEIKSKMKFNLNFLHAIRRLKWDWAGHVARLENNKRAK